MPCLAKFRWKIQKEAMLVFPVFNFPFNMRYNYITQIHDDVIWQSLLYVFWKWNVLTLYTQFLSWSIMCISSRWWFNPSFLWTTLLFVFSRTFWNRLMIFCRTQLWRFFWWIKTIHLWNLMQNIDDMVVRQQKNSTYTSWSYFCTETYGHAQSEGTSEVWNTRHMTKKSTF